MSLRRALMLVGLVGAIAWLHGWAVLRPWVPTPPVASLGAAQPPAVQVVWHSPASPIDRPLSEAAAATLDRRVPERTAPRSASPARVSAARAIEEVASVTHADAAEEALPAAPMADDRSGPPVDPASLLPDTLHAVAAIDAAAATVPASATGPREPSPVPTYRTRMPPAALVNYQMSRSGLTGTGELEWRPEAGAYRLRLEGRMPLIGTLITQTSRGHFDAAGLAPERYTDKRLRRGEQAANFERSEGVISFSGQSPAVPITAGVQDRVSVMVQLAAIAAAWSKPPAVGTSLQIRVVGARGDANVWSLRFEGEDTVDTPGGTVPALRFLRAGDGPNATRAEFWLDPARSHLPVRVRLSDGGSDPLELLRLR